LAGVGSATSHNTGDAAGAGSEQRLVDRDTVEGSMLFVDHHEVEADAAENFRCVWRWAS